MISLFFRVEQHSILHMYQMHHLDVHGHLGWLHLWSYLGICPRLAHVVILFSFLRNLQADFYTDCNHLHYYPQCLRVPFFPPHKVGANIYCLLPLFFK